MRIVKLTFFDNIWNRESSVSLLTIKSMACMYFSFPLITSVIDLLKSSGNNRDKTIILELNALSKPDLWVPRKIINRKK